MQGTKMLTEKINKLNKPLPMHAINTDDSSQNGKNNATLIGIC